MPITRVLLYIMYCLFGCVILNSCYETCSRYIQGRYDWTTASESWQRFFNVNVVVATFNQEKALVGAFSVITNLRMDLFEVLVDCEARVAVIGQEVQAQLPNIDPARSKESSAVNN